MTEPTGIPEQKEHAQQRADRIGAFREELAQLEQEQVLTLTDEQRKRVAAYHDATLQTLARQFDIDTTSAEKQMSWGMRIVSFLGALALSAAVFFFFYRFWGLLATPLQVAILIAAPLLSVTFTEFAARRERTLYLASIIALVAFACFVLDLNMLGSIFNITPTQNAFLAWGAFALILAYGYGLRLLLVAGIISLMGYLTATVGTWSGCYWLSFGERPENFIVSGLILFCTTFIPHRRHYDFPAIYRLFGLLAALTAILVLANWGSVSYLAWSPKRVEHLYQIAGFAVSALAIWLGIRRHWSGVTNLGSTFFVIFLYTKFYDWWWEWMPKYLFFLVVGATAVLLLVVMKRLRASAA